MKTVSNCRRACSGRGKYMHTGTGVSASCAENAANTSPVSPFSGRTALFCLVAVLCFLMLGACHCRRAHAAEASRPDGATPDFVAASSAHDEAPGLVLAMGGRGERDSLPAGDAGSMSASPSGASSSQQLMGGSFLGALFFGYPYNGLGMIDIVVGGLLVFLIVRLVARRRRTDRGNPFDAQQHNARLRNSDEQSRQSSADDRPTDAGQPGGQAAKPGTPYDNAWSRRTDRTDGQGGGNASSGRSWKIDPGQDGRDDRPANPVTMKDRAASMWGYYSGEQRAESRDPGTASVAPGVDVPRDFDVADFLEGARTLYVRLQQAWASRKLDELESFVSPELFNLLSEQAARDPNPTEADILLVEAELASVSRNGDREEATVNFSVSMRSGADSAPKDIRERWRFARGSASGGMWRLEGIEQA